MIVDGQPTIVVVGGGQAAASALRELSGSGHRGRLVMVSAEDRLPYDRTTLSKSALLGGPEVSPPGLWPPDEPWPRSIEVRLGTEVTGIGLRSKKLVTSAGETLAFDKLLLATGARPRRLAIEGADGQGVHYLRDALDAAAIRAALLRPSRLVIIGGGVIGLEVAATARRTGHQVEVVEAGPRLLGRSVPAEVAAHLAKIHTHNGVRLRTGVAPERIIRENGLLTGVRLTDGHVVAADVVVVGIGIHPHDELAAAAGLAVDDGIIVDRSGRTSHLDVFAAGDAVRMRSGAGERGVRSESWQAAGRQGEIAARSMLGADVHYTDPVWTWSDQYDVMLQSVGNPSEGAQSIVSGHDGGDAVLVLSVLGGRIVSACGVAPGGGIAKPIRAVQLLLQQSAAVDLDEIFASCGDLKTLTRTLVSSARSARAPL